jgi:transcription-repair coupling factor (superfamily II helicase)
MRKYRKLINEKQTFGRIKNTLAILLAVLFVLSITATPINAKAETSISGIKKTAVIGPGGVATKVTGVKKV